MKIKIIKGGYGHKAEGSLIVELKDKNSDPFDVSDAEGRRLIEAGVAEEVNELPWETPSIDADPDQETTIKAHLDAEDLGTYSHKELQALAKDMGLSAAGSKADLIERITAEEVEVPVDEDEPPVLSAADPE